MAEVTVGGPPGNPCDPWPTKVDERLIALENAVNRLADEVAYWRLKHEIDTRADKTQPSRGTPFPR